MFKAILPTKRIPSSDFTMITQLNTGKENHKPSLEKRKRSNTKPTDDSQAFDKLLDDLQIPHTVRIKLAGMDSTVKAAMVKSSQTMALPSFSGSPPVTPRSKALRKTRSTESLASPGHIKCEELLPPRAPFASSDLTPRKASAGHSKNLSCDSPGWKSRSQIHLPASASVTDLNSLGKPSTKEKSSALTKSISPAKIVAMIANTSSTQIDIEIIKKLRLLLRNESAAWSQEFLKERGYSVLVTRLDEILEIEWREEQHDDQVLHELLRCFKALSTSSIGCFALRSSCPTPFLQLVTLLYSDKKPGDVSTRQLIVELLLILFELYPSSSLPCLGGNSNSFSRSEIWEKDSASQTTSSLIRFPAPHKNLFSLIRALLLTPAPPPTESLSAPISPHAFIESLHRPRIYKAYLQELSDVCRDYFWVFCHPNNKIWLLDETDEGRVEKPRAPGGMTGGVEFEAMGYFTTHLKLINAIAKASADLNLPKENDLSAFRFHMDLFLSGFERIILVSRKASTTYYPTLHLELARYIAQATEAGYDLPANITELLGLPPAACCKNTQPTTSRRDTPSPTKKSAPFLPPSKRLEK